MTNHQNRIKQLEKWLIRLIVIQFIFLIIGQWLVSNNDLALYFNKSIRYEGVTNTQENPVTETMEHVKPLW